MNSRTDTLGWLLAGLVILLTGAVGCTSSQKVAMKPATFMMRDVFTCKGLTADKRWIGVTDEFDPETDPRVVVVAQLAEEDLDSRIQYELVNPLNTVVIVETVDNPTYNPLGIYVEMSRLMEMGGEGQWTANVFTNGQPLGQAKFYLGEKPEDEAPDTGYFVVGAEDTATEDEQQASSQYPGTFIEEVTPELDIPQNNFPTIDPSGSTGQGGAAAPPIENATPSEALNETGDEELPQGRWIDNEGTAPFLPPQIEP